jgi:hypothetical protein
MHPTWPVRGPGLVPGRTLNPSEVESSGGSEKSQVERQVEGQVEVKGMVRDRVTVQEAARRLGVKDDAIRKRIQRGSLEYDKGEDGRVYVYLEPSSAVSGDARGGEAAQDASYDALLVGLQDQVSYLRSVLREERDARRRADTIIAQLTRANAALAQRVPELQAPRRRDGTARETEGEDPAGEDPAGVHEVDGTGEPRGPVRPRDTAEFPVRASLTRPWWRRAFGG